MYLVEGKLLIMLQTYKATLRGDRLEWSDAAPHAVANDQPVAVHVTILDEVQPPTTHQTSGQKMAAILEQLACRAALPATNSVDPLQ